MKCKYCGEEYSSSVMSFHLLRCDEKKKLDKENAGEPTQPITDENPKDVAEMTFDEKKTFAKENGINFPVNIGEEKLTEKIKAKLIEEA